MRALLPYVVVLVALLSACGQPRCNADAQCGVSQMCAPSGICLSKCTSQASCGGGQTCNAQGVCVSPTTGCAVSSDCNPGQICAPGGTCQSMNPNVDAGPVSCGGQKFESTPTEANILVVLDHSGSMQEVIANAQSKWVTATQAVRAVTAQNASNPGLRFGLQLFSHDDMICNPGTVSVAIGPGTSTAIASALPPSATGRQTPIAGALRVAANSGQLNDPARANYVLLITDGMENCGGAPVAEVEGLFSRGVRTYTVGFGSEVDANRLSQMAIKGGTARGTTPRYFQADNQAELQAALGAIASGAASCDFTLASTPPNPQSLYVAVDGQFFPRDPARVAGWDYQPAGNRVTLYGPACDVVTQRPGAKVTIIYGCPDDSLVEIGPGGRLPPGGGGGSGTDGGFGWPSDGGIPEIN